MYINRPVHPSRSSPHDDYEQLITQNSVNQGLVVIVDDNPYNLMVGEFMVQQLGYEVVCAKNGEEGIAKVKDLHSKGVLIKCILMDLQMPIMNGYEAISKLKELMDSNVLSRIPVVALTAHDSEEEKSKCADIGTDGFLTKPLKIDNLRNLFSSLSYSVSD